MNQKEQLFWYDPEVYTLHHTEFTDSSDMYTFINHLTQAKGLSINCWNLKETCNWYTSAMNGGSRPGRTNMWNVIDDNVPKDIKALCLILNINWRTD